MSEYELSNEEIKVAMLDCWLGGGGGVRGILSDGDDRMEPKVKTQKNP